MDRWEDAEKNVLPTKPVNADVKGFLHNLNNANRSQKHESTWI